MIPTLSPATSGRGLPLDDYVSLAQRHGFHGVEFNIQAAADLAAERGFNAVADVFEAAKVLPIVTGLTVDWRQDEATFRADMERLPALAKLSQDLDCSRWCTWVAPATSEPAAEYAQRSIERFIEIARVLGDNGIRFGLEFLGPKHFRTDAAKVWFYDIPGALQVVDDIERAGEVDNVGLLVDSWHWYTSGGSLMDVASIPLEQIVHVHINDAPAIAREEQIDNERLLPGESGVIDIVGFLKTLSALGYLGPIAVETFNAKLNSMPVDESAALAVAAVKSVFDKAGIQPLRLL